jgi:hypothetical protein
MTWRRRQPKVRYVSVFACAATAINCFSSDTADKKRAENPGKGYDSDDSDRPKKKAVPKGKANGKSKGRT